MQAVYLSLLNWFIGGSGSPGLFDRLRKRWKVGESEAPKEQD
jgi:hypothetical protein